MIVREVFNGVSMFAPTAVMALRAPNTLFGKAAVIGTAVHACVSCTYHFTCAANLNNDPVNCFWRRMDQTFIHVNAALLAYCTSHEFFYFLAASIVNAHYVKLLWKGGVHDTSLSRRRRIFFAFGMYFSPILLNNRTASVRMMAAFLASSAAFCFDKSMGGIGHTVFHLGMAAFCVDFAAVI